MIKADSLRKREFYTSYIYQRFNNDLSPQYQPGRILGEKELNDLIDGRIKDKNERKIFTREADQAYKEFLTEDRYFDWIKNERIALFFIQYIHNNIYGNYLPEMFVMKNDNPANHYPRCDRTPHVRDMGLPESPSGLRELKDIIILYFDRLSIHVEHKEALMDYIKSVWFSQSVEWLDWIDDKNENQMNWAAGYIETHFRSSNDTLYYYKSSSSLSKIYGFLDFCFNSNDSRELFIIKMKKAWAQNCYRESIKDKKVINTYVSNDVKEKLKEIVRVSNKKTNEVISDLIRREYNNLKKR